MGPSIAAWAEELMKDRDFRTGYPLAHDWQVKNTPLPEGYRLVPRVPFVLGGKFEVDNLYRLMDINAMMFRATIANRIRDVPDGGTIMFKLDLNDQSED